MHEGGGSRVGSNKLVELKKKKKKRVYISHANFLLLRGSQPPLPDQTELGAEDKASSALPWLPTSGQTGSRQHGDAMDHIQVV